MSNILGNCDQHETPREGLSDATCPCTARIRFRNLILLSSSIGGGRRHMRQAPIKYGARGFRSQTGLIDKVNYQYAINICESIFWNPVRRDALVGKCLDHYYHENTESKCNAEYFHYPSLCTCEPIQIRARLVLSLKSCRFRRLPSPR